jgi:type I restriction-modification system DNA methylase subunit
MNDPETKQAIVTSLAGFAHKPLTDAATALFESLGYKSQKRIVLQPNTAETFFATFAKEKPLNPDLALLADWQSVDFLFQITDEEVRAAAAGKQQFLFEAHGRWNGAEINSFLFLAIRLAKAHYSRTELSGITRAVNRLFPMPAMLLFRHGDTLTLAVIPRRLHKRDESKDVLAKVTLIKDIRFANPHRAHVEILADLSFDALHEKHGFINFVALHAAWQEALDSSELNKRFFLEVANWYFWALGHAEFPKEAPKQDGKDHISVIRLITRLMFCWFVKEKGLVPDSLFDERKLTQALTGFEPSKTSNKESVFYKAILQNLFFATLNTEMHKRAWRKDDNNFMAHIFYRHRELFQKQADALDLFKNIPFLNGGLFECLDKREGTKESPKDIRIDGFSDREDSQPTVPDFLFFGPEREVDLSEDYGDTKFRKVKVRGLIHTFNHYKFTVAENTPIEEEIALDPELSGKVFENLLAAYNPETGATARKQTGSFYTPREIVNYMVDEAVIACLKTKLEVAMPTSKDVEASLRQLFEYNNEPHKFTAPEVDALISAIDSLKTLDPAVGSGAFPMGILHKLVFILGKLDPNNEKWRERQRQRAMAETEEAFKVGDKEERLRRLEDIKEVFESNASDYGRKLYLIENCIYGVDIQIIAVQIAKMRFFISLIVDQKTDDSQANRGVRPLPNLETKFVAANTLIGVNRPGQQLLRNRDIETKEAELRRVRERYFLARTPKQKAKCRDEDARLRAEIAELLKGDGWDTTTARKLADWNPYDQNASADFFDAEWMFSIIDGYDVLIANPPYISYYSNTGNTLTESQRVYLVEHFDSVQKSNDRINSMNLFAEKGFRLLKQGGHQSLITNKTLAVLPSYVAVRAYLLKNSTINYLATNLDPFEAIVDCIVLGVTKQKPAQNYKFRWFSGQVLDFETREVDQFSKNRKMEFHFARNQSVIQRVESANGKLEDLVVVNRGVNIGGCFEHFLSCTKRSTDHYKYLSGTRSIYRFGYEWSSERDGFFVFDTEKEASLRNQGETLVLGNPDRFLQDRLFIPESGQTLMCAYASERIYSAYGIMVGTAKSEKFNLKYVCALLNSQLLSFYAIEKEILRKGNKATPHVGVRGLNAIPVWLVSEEEQRVFVRLVDEILALKQSQPQADTTALEGKLDQQVYALYGLTPGEIKIVEDARV